MFGVTANLIWMYIVPLVMGNICYHCPDRAGPTLKKFTSNLLSRGACCTQIWLEFSTMLRKLEIINNYCWKLWSPHNSIMSYQLSCPIKGNTNITIKHLLLCPSVKKKLQRNCHFHHFRSSDFQSFYGHSSLVQSLLDLKFSSQWPVQNCITENNQCWNKR